MFFFKLTVAAATIQSVWSCPAAKKSNLRSEDVESYHRKLSQIIGVESERLEANSQINAPVCTHVSFTGLAGPSRVAYTAPGTANANTAIQTVYASLRTDFYQLIDAYQNGTPLPAWATVVSQDPLSLFPITVAAPTNLSLLQKAYRVSNLIGAALRLAFHDAGEVDIRATDLFGSDGCLADNGPNSGLKEVNTVTNTIIETAWQRYCDKITRADFWVLFAKIAAEASLPNGRFPLYVAIAQAVGGLVVPPNPSPYMPYLNIPYQYGRKDAVGDCNGGSLRANGVHRLPGHQPGLSEFTEVYVNQMGLDVRTGVVLSGAHSTGHVHTAFSGFGFNDDLAALELDPLTNAWDETPWVFDNAYFDSLAVEFWLNNPHQVNVIQNEGGNTANPSPSIPSNAGTNFWAVQIAPGILQPVPNCIDTATCGAIPIVGANPPVPNAAALTAAGGLEVIFCVVNGVTHYATQSLETNPANSWQTLNRFTNRADSTNACNCAQFFAIPPLLDGAILTARGCALGPHPKTIMLNADMVQNFPISGAGVTPVKNLITANPGAIQDLGVGDFGELCAPAVAVRTAVGTTILNSNQAAANRNLVFPQPSLAGRITNQNCAGANQFNAGCPLNPQFRTTSQGFGCVKNSLGNPPNFLGQANVQTMASTLLPSDPNNPSVSLWATVQSFLTLGVAGSCIEGISTYRNPLDGTRNPYTGALQTAVPNYATYSGAVTQALAAGGYIGENILVNDELVTCTEATRPFGEGRDNFYREFEIAFVKMVTAGFTYSYTFRSERIINGVRRTVTVPVTASGNGKMGTLTNIVLRNTRQTRNNIDSCARSLTPTLPNYILPANIQWQNLGGGVRIMTGGPLFGSSTCCVGEVC